MYAWAEDGIFPKAVSRIHTRFNTPYLTIVLSGVMASIGILGSHFAGDFFLGIDILVTSMLVNFILVCLSVLFLPIKNPSIASNIKLFRKQAYRLLIAILGVITLTVFLIIHIAKDMSASLSGWYFHSTYIWLIVMAIASLIFFKEVSKLRNSGVAMTEIFSKLPPE